MVEINTVEQDQPSQDFEFADHIISSSSGLTTLYASHSYAHMCIVDHVDIIGSITDSQGSAPLFHNGCDLLLTLW